MSGKKPKVLSSIMEEINAVENATSPLNEQMKSNIILVPIADINEIQLNYGLTMHNRVTYSSLAIKELAANIKDIEPNGLLGTGLMQPVVLRRNPNGVIERIAGFRRIEAFKINNDLMIPAIILENISDATARFMRNSENLNREDINPYDQIYGIIENIAIYLNMTFEKTVSFLNKIKNSNSGKSTFSPEDKELYSKVSDVVKKISRFEVGALIERLVTLNMNPLIIDVLKENEINYSQAKEVNKVKDDEIVKNLLRFVKNKQPSISELKLKIAELNPKIRNSEVNEIIHGLSKPIIRASDYKKIDSGKKALADDLLKQAFAIKLKLEELLK